jgi:tRNA 2-thiouridine synthesizing protein A
MAFKELNAVGLRCPQPVLKMTAMMPTLQPGDVLRVSGDCPTFEADVRKWTDRMKKTMLGISRDGNKITIEIQF